MTTMYYEADAKPELLKDKKIAILGYGPKATHTRSTCTTAATTYASVCAPIPRPSPKPRPRDFASSPSPTPALRPTSS